MNRSPGAVPQASDATGLAIGIVAARFNPAICEALLAGARAELERLGAATIVVERVAGALELPLALQWLAQSGRFAALLALGAVVRGETHHFEVVANESARGIADVALASGVPIANGVLTVDTEAQAEARLAKGAECARVAVEMARFGARWRGRA